MLIGGFRPFTLSDFPGTTAAIVFTRGCNLRCPYCHNRALWAASPKASDKAPEEVLDFMAHRTGCLGGLVITGGEPTLQPDLPEFLRRVRELGFAVKLDTNGTLPDSLAGLLDHGLVDYVAMDIKAPISKYGLICGVAVDTDAILRSISLIAASGVPHHFRTTFFRPLLSEADLATIKTLLPVRSRFLVQPFWDATGALGGT